MAACSVAVKVAILGTAAVSRAMLTFRHQYSTVRGQLPSSFWTGQTGELYGQWILEIMCHFSKSAITSEIPVHATAEIRYYGTLVIFELGSVGPVWSTCTVAFHFLLGLGLVLVLKNHTLLSGKCQFHLVKTSKPKIFSLCFLIAKKVDNTFSVYSSDFNSLPSGSHAQLLGILL